VFFFDFAETAFSAFLSRRMLACRPPRSTGGRAEDDAPVRYGCATAWPRQYSRPTADCFGASAARWTSWTRPGSTWYWGANCPDSRATMTAAQVVRNVHTLFTLQTPQSRSRDLLPLQRSCQQTPGLSRDSASRNFGLSGPILEQQMSWWRASQALIDRGVSGLAGIRCAAP
jgi:hypothetical protein